ncbi:MAG: Na+-driven multidrug efflux pump [Paracoccaceae bacterium]|jgi:Na+-driven multidrug efflux pump
MTFMFLPLLGMSMAFQTIVDNNFGARRRDRTRAATRITLVVAFGYCVGMQLIFHLSAPTIGSVFVDDVMMQRELARILPIGTLTLFLFGPLMMVATYFQAIGEAMRAAVLNLSRTFVFAIPLTLALPYLIGEPGIWSAGVIAELLVLALTVAVAVLMRLRAR